MYNKIFNAKSFKIIHDKWKIIENSITVYLQTTTSFKSKN